MDAKPPPKPRSRSLLDPTTPLGIAARSAGFLAGFLVVFMGLSAGVMWVEVHLLSVAGLLHMFSSMDVVFFDVCTIALLLFGATHLGELLTIIRMGGPLPFGRRIPPQSSLLTAVVWAVTILVGLAGFVGIIAGLVWCEARLLQWVGLRRPAPTWVLVSLSFFPTWFLLRSLKYLVELLDRILDSRPVPPAPPPPPPPPLTPEEQARIQAWKSALSDLRAAIAKGVCPKCGAGGFHGGETFQNSVTWAGRDGGFGGGLVFKVWGRCSACGHSEELPFMR